MTVAVPSFAPPHTVYADPFWDGVAANELRLPRCTGCGAFQWYPLAGVDHCSGAILEWTTVGPVGTIFTFTVVRRPFLPGSSKSDVPNTSVLVELDEARGVRLVGRLTDGFEPEIGLRVAGEFFDNDGRRDLQFTPLGAGEKSSRLNGGSDG
jgi:uncharacterized protein